MDLRDGGSTAGFSTAGGARARITATEPTPLPALTILGHPSIDRVGDFVLLGELAAGREVDLSRYRPRFSAPGMVASGAVAGRSLDDPFLSRRPLRFETLPGGGVRLHRGGSRTHLRVDGVAVETSHDIVSEALDHGVVLELARRLVLLLHRRLPSAETTTERCGLIGDSESMERLRSAIDRVADLDVPVLLRGETGTGKELVARALHDQSPRRDQAFIAVNLGALPSSLAAAELFGVRKGAYTGADRDRQGTFRRADGGTLFLDEIGDAPPEIQVMLLRTLETRDITPVGGRGPRRVDVRIVSATDADLDRLIAGGDFRSQLLHRLAGYTIQLPALRRRRDDLGRLLMHFLHLERRAAGEPPPSSDPGERDPWLNANLVARLARYDWPGNVRQLRNVVRQLVIDSRGQRVLGTGACLDDLLPIPAASQADARAADAPEPDRQPAPYPASPQVDEASAVDAAPTEAPRRKPSEVTEDEMLAALREQRWNLKATARALRVSRTSLYALLERSPNVRAAADVPAAEIHRAWERHHDDLDAMVSELEISERALRQRLKDLGLR